MDLTSALQWFLGVVLLGSGSLKLAAQDGFLRSLASLPWLPLRYARRLVRTIPLTEIALAVLVVLSPVIGGGLVAVAFLVFTFVVCNELLHGRHFDCGCFGGSSRHSVGAATVGRNLLLIAIAAAAAATHDPPVLGGAMTGIAAGLTALLWEVGIDTRRVARTS